MTTETVTEMTRLDAVAELAAQLRVDSIRSSTSAGSGHPTSSMSAADLIAVLAARHLRYDWDDPHAAANDHLVFSKGHASPLLYSLFKAAGVVSDEELMTGYRRFGQRLEGHPTPVLPWVDVATGSLGQGLPDGVGIALSGKYLEHLPFRVWVLCGDSELAEGSIWEALDKASYYKLSNLVVMADINRLGPARAHRSRVGPRRLPTALRSLRRPRPRHRRSRPLRHRRRVRRGGEREWGPAHGDTWPRPSRDGASRRSRTKKAGTASLFRPTWRRAPSRSSGASGTWSFVARSPRRSRTAPSRP